MSGSALDIALLAPGEATALEELLGSCDTQESYGGDGLRVFDGMAAAAARGEVAVARIAGEVVGYTRIFPPHNRAHGLVECFGEVFKGSRRRGAGTALVQWTIEAVAASGESLMTELVIDRDGDDHALAAILERSGFSQTAGVQFTATVGADTRLDAAPKFVTQALTLADHDHLVAAYTSKFSHEPHAGRGRAALEAVLRHEGLRPDLSRVAWVAPGVVDAFALALVWPDDPEDLWVETVCIGCSQDSTITGEQLLQAVMAGAVGHASTVSIGLPGDDSNTAVRAAYESLGFVPVTSWARHTLLIAGGSQRLTP